MEGTVIDGADRRRTRRHDCAESHGIVSAQVRPGHRAMVINICADGALIETSHRLLPGSHVDMLFHRSHYRASIRGRVLRCAVVRVHAASMCYRGAIGFDRSLPWFVEHERLHSIQPV